MKEIRVVRLRIRARGCYPFLHLPEPLFIVSPLTKGKYFSVLFLFCRATITAHDYRADQDTILQMRYRASSPKQLYKFKREGGKKRIHVVLFQNTRHEVETFYSLLRIIFF